jgi:hypothetical protein
MHSDLNRLWFALGGLLALWIALEPDRFIKFVSYGKARITNIAPALVNTLRIVAAVVVLCTLVAFVSDAWSVS